ncbi:hypothetical protein VPNG_06066 [Cytospora leucostoma]|uniref:Cupin 2 conserved barrel domain-containing protein n=1 Tax=Cytospora leucostoma TaxID=1230097 RepID=A0A423WX06_9PEZI|nr:hypothetical protein VPNG_06066 [Cytospora leucostoma]
MASDDRSPTENQISSNPGAKVHITTHNDEGRAVWVRYDDDKLLMSVLYTTQFPSDLNDEADVKLHRSRVAQGPQATGLTLKGGTVLRYVEFAPGYTCMMHRTQSLDYGIVMEGSVVALFDSGEEQVMHRGDVMVQRATMHAWKNQSEKDWARMLFCLQDTKPLFVGEERFKEAGIENLPPSGNDN